MEAINPHFEGVKPFFDAVSVDIVELTAQPYSREGSQIAVAIDKNHCVGEVVFFGQFVQERSSWIGTSLSEHCDIENTP